MEILLREAKEKHDEIPATLKEQIVLEHAPLIQYVVSRIAARLPSHADLDDLYQHGRHRPDGCDREATIPRRTASSRPTPSSGSRAPSSISCARSTGCRAASGRRVAASSGPMAKWSSVWVAPQAKTRWPTPSGLQIDKFHELLNQVRGHLPGEPRGDPRHELRRRPIRHLRRHRRRRELRESLRVAQAHSRRST